MSEAGADKASTREAQCGAAVPDFAARLTRGAA